MPALVDVAREELELAARQSLARSVKETERLGGARVRRDGKDYVSFSCNDYLGLAHHPRVIAAARERWNAIGAGAGASRLVTGSHPPYAVLEKQLAELKGTERALVFGSGYLANLGVIPALVRQERPDPGGPALARLHVGRHPAFRRDGDALRPQQPRALRGAAAAAPGRVRALSDPDRDRLQHGGRPRPDRRAGTRWPARTMPG